MANNTIAPPSSGSAQYSISASGGGGAGASGYSFVTGVNSSATGVNSSANFRNTVEINGQGADLVIDKKSMKQWMEAVEKRLAILQPKPELLEKYEALKQAYDHYKTLEGLLYDANSEL